MDSVLALLDRNDLNEILYCSHGNRGILALGGKDFASRKNRGLIDSGCLRRYPRGRRARLRDAKDDLSAARDRGSPRADSAITGITAPPRRLTLIPL